MSMEKTRSRGWTENSPKGAESTPKGSEPVARGYTETNARGMED
jgi:hypothetical protein